MGETVAIKNPNYTKAELTFEINSFGKPLELSGIEAWTRDVLRILFMEKGTMPSDPEMGCGITREMYHDIQTLKGTIRTQAESQIRQYLPDVPFLAMNVYSEDELVSDGNPNIVYYMISFQKNADEIKTVTVASKVTHKVIDFEIRF